MNETEVLREWIRRHDVCVTCGRAGQTQKHHVKTRGSMRGMDKIDQDRENIVPLCVNCHAKVHSMGHLTFQKKFSIDLTATAKFIWKSAMKGTEFEVKDE